MIDPEDLLEIPYMTRSQRKAKRKGSGNKQKQNRQLPHQQYGKPKEERSPLSLKPIYPKTDNQGQIYTFYHQQQNLLLHGFPGTGKTFLACYLAIDEVLKNNDIYKKVVIVRSALATRDIGFLPGKKEDKEKAFEEPYYEIFTKLFGRPDAYDSLKRRGLIEFRTTSHIRGVTIDDSIVVVDECQNLSFHENASVITRLGDNARLIFCGDFRQSDHRFKDEKQGVVDFLDVIRDMKSFSNVEMGIDDIVRGPVVKDFIIQCAKKGLV